MSSYANLDDLNKKLLKKDRFKLSVKHEDSKETSEGIVSVEISMPRAGSPSVLKFEIVKEFAKDLDFGNAVLFKVDDENYWFGYIFSFDDSEEEVLEVTCYDQLRYLKNKDTYQYTDTTYSELLKKICDDQILKIGTIEDTEFTIPRRIEEDKEYFEILQYASDITTAITGKIFILYDDCGEICLKNTDSLKVKDLIIHEELGQSYSYHSSIDDNTYNRIKVDVVDQETNEVTPVIAEDGANMAKWGRLQWYDLTTEPLTQVEAKAEQLLKLLNKPTRSITFNGMIGNAEVRGGSQIPALIELRDIEINGFMFVDHVTHKFEDGMHTMDLTVYSKDFMPSISTDNIFEYEQKQTQGQASGGDYAGGMVGNTVQEKVWSFFLSKGYSKEAIAGILGNMSIESNFNPNAVGDGGTSYGLCQWHAGRWEALKNWCNSNGYDWKTAEGQINFLHHELQTSYNGKHFMNIKNVNEATDWFTTHYEIPNEAVANRPGRKAYANKIYNQLNNWNPAPAGPAESAGVTNAFVQQALTRKGMPYNSGSLRMTATHDDCSSLVDKSLRKAGMPNTMGQDLTTRNIHRDSRFYEIPISQARYGDVLWTNGHVAVYLGDNRTFEAFDYGKPTGYSYKNNRFSKAYRIRGT